MSKKESPTKAKAVNWKKFDVTITGLTAQKQQTRIEESVLCTKYPQLESLVKSLRRQDKLKLTLIETDTGIEVEVFSIWSEESLDQGIQLTLKM